MGSSSSTSRTGTTPNLSGPFEPYPSDMIEGISQPTSVDELINKIKSTQIYKTVYQVFSQASNSTYWLGQLQSILDGIAMPDFTFLDRWNWSQGFDDKVQAIYNDAISAISKLYAQYQEHVNSLPSTSVQQDAVAGINSAITGNIHGSSLSTDPLSDGSPYGMQSTNALEGISTIASFALDSVTGLCGVMSSFADVALKFKDLDLRSSQFGFDKVKSFAEFKNLLSKDGVILNSSSWDELESMDPHWNDNANSRATALYNAYKEYTDSLLKMPALAHGVSSGQYSDRYIQGTTQEDGLTDGYGSKRPYGFYGFNLEREYSDLGRLQTDLMMNELQRRVEVGNTNLAEGLTPEEVAQATAREDKANASFNARKAVIFLERLESLVSRSNNHDPIASVELINLMNNADWQESAVYMFGELSPEVMQDIGSSLFNISSWNSEQFNKVIDFFKSKL